MYVTWQLEFYSECRRTLSHYRVEAQTPDAAQVLGRQALLAEYRSAPPRRAGSLFEQAQRVGGDDADGWVLYRITRMAPSSKSFAG